MKLRDETRKSRGHGRQSMWREEKKKRLKEKRQGTELPRKLRTKKTGGESSKSSLSPASGQRGALKRGSEHPRKIPDDQNRWPRQGLPRPYEELSQEEWGVKGIRRVRPDVS